MPLSTREVKSLRDRIAAAGGLANAADLSRIWEVSRARVSELTSMRDFPEPIDHVGKRPVWLLEQVDQWRQARLKPSSAPAE